MAFVEGDVSTATVLSVVWVEYGDDGLKVFYLASLPFSWTLSRKSWLFLGLDLKHLEILKSSNIIVNKIVIVLTMPYNFHTFTEV